MRRLTQVFAVCAAFLIPAAAHAAEIKLIASNAVKEAYLEVDVPILNSDSTGKLNINAAGRVTDYSTSGTVWAWKVGGTWDLPAAVKG